MSIGTNIRRAREAANLTQAEFSRMIHVSQPMLCQIERGTRPCSMGLGAEIARALGLHIGDLYGDEQEGAQ